MDAEKTLVHRILLELPNGRGQHDAEEIANKLGAESGRVKTILSDLRRAGIAREGYYGWRLGHSKLLRFLHEWGWEEFTQNDVVGATGLSQPTVSRRMKVLVDLGIVAVSRHAGVPGTGGRVVHYARVL